MLNPSREWEYYHLKVFLSCMVVPFGQQVVGFLTFSEGKGLEKFQNITILSMKGNWYTNEVGLYSTIQIPSGYYLQTMNSNLNFSGFVLPIAAMNVISIVPLLILVPILECINSCLFSSKESGRSPTIYIGMLENPCVYTVFICIISWKRNFVRW